ncbi:MAG: DUF4340 domain-containing protein [Fulvivirga sp.]|nr:DUF4340 domain-containing protein [Fulvivirga sp.]
MQSTKNRKLALVLLLLTGFTVAMYFLLGDDPNQIDVDRSLFAYKATGQIDQVHLAGPELDVSLNFEGGQWMIGNDKADPQRTSVLFAILQQVRIRRAVPKNQADSIRQLIDSNGVTARFYDGDQVVHEMKVLGDEYRGVTYMSLPDEENVYLTQIPGYRSFLAGMFTIDALGWRDPLVFDFDWINLQQVEMIYPGRKDEQFEVVFDENIYRMKGVQSTDTTKLFDFLDNISRLYVNDYLAEDEWNQGMISDTTATIVVQDVGGNKLTLEIFNAFEGQNNQFLVRIDSSDMGVVSRESVRRVLRPKKYFREEKKQPYN